MIKKSICVVVLAMPLLFASSCGALQDEISHEKTEDVQIVTEAEKASKIATETPQKPAFSYDPDYGEPPEEVQRILDKFQDVERELEEESIGEIDVNGYGWVQLQYDKTYHIADNHLTKSNGLIFVFGHRETWYSIHEPGQTVTAKEIPGKHVAEDGTIRDEDGYVCVASSDLPFYSIVMTSVGPAKVYDCGCSSGTIDVYTNW